jgi:hypothetical protein
MINITEKTQCIMRPPWGVGRDITFPQSSTLGGEFALQIRDHGIMLLIPMTCLTIWKHQWRSRLKMGGLPLALV